MLQQIPEFETEHPPLAVIFPPLVAELGAIIVITVVERVERRHVFVVNSTSFP